MPEEWWNAIGKLVAPFFAERGITIRSFTYRICEHCDGEMDIPTPKRRAKCHSCGKQMTVYRHVIEGVMGGRDL